MTSLILLSRLTWCHAELTFISSSRFYIRNGWSYSLSTLAKSLNEEVTLFLFFFFFGSIWEWCLNSVQCYPSPFSLSLILLFFAAFPLCFHFLGVVEMGLWSYGFLLMLVFILPSSSIALERTSSGRLLLRHSYRPCVHHDEHRSVVRLNPRFNMRTIHLPEPRSVPPIEIWCLHRRLGYPIVALSYV